MDDEKAQYSPEGQLPDYGDESTTKNAAMRKNSIAIGEAADIYGDVEEAEREH